MTNLRKQSEKYFYDIQSQFKEELKAIQKKDLEYYKASKILDKFLMSLPADIRTECFANQFKY